MRGKGRRRKGRLRGGAPVLSRSQLWQVNRGEMVLRARWREIGLQGIFHVQSFSPISVEWLKPFTATTSVLSLLFFETGSNSFAWNNSLNVTRAKTKKNTVMEANRGQIQTKRKEYKKVLINLVSISLSTHTSSYTCIYWSVHILMHQYSTVFLSFLCVLVYPSSLLASRFAFWCGWAIPFPPFPLLIIVLKL